MRRGFTMIELIFVIVIIGILAAVAIPKLATTRNDAEAAKIANNLATCVNDAGAAYLANGRFNATKTDKITDSPACTSGIKSNPTTDCYTFSVDDGAGTLLVIEKNAATKACSLAHALTEKNGLSNSSGGVTHNF